MAYKIGTRKSLLAITQSKQIMNQLARHTKEKWELFTVTTKGDLDQKTPLWQMEQNNVFTKELDEALMLNQCDCTIHSYKDLGLLRPDQLTLGAITKRSYPHDILLLKKTTIQNIFNNTLTTLKVGTSSPRRTVNLNRFLKSLIAYDGTIECLPLRGNINGRIEKLNRGDCDAIVLAMAGLERLAQDETARTELIDLVRELNFFILPLSLFPGAAAQGALAIEVKKDKFTDFSPILGHVHDEKTASEVSLEKKIFAKYGGGCHLPIGIFVRQFDDGFIYCHQGNHQGIEVNVLKLDILRPAPPPNSRVFIGSKKKTSHLLNDSIVYNQLIDYAPLPLSEKIEGNVIFTSPNVLTNLPTSLDLQTIWASGITTTKTLFKRRCWVNGCGDFLGEEGLLEFKESHFVRLFTANRPWNYLTNDQSTSALGKAIATYTRIIKNVDDQYQKKIEACNVFYWMSFYQYQKYIETFPSIAAQCHCCGLGKTYKSFKESKIPVIPFVDLAEFHNWLKQPSKE